MMWLWTGEVATEGQGYRVLGTGPKGTLQIPPEIAKHFPAVLHLRLTAMNANGKVYSIGQDHPADPVILAIDTTHEFGSIALLDTGRSSKRRPLHATEGFGHVLYGHISAMLDRHGRCIDDIDCFAAASGPGSFTACESDSLCVKGLAEAAENRWRLCRICRRWRHSAPGRCAQPCSMRAAAKSTAVYDAELHAVSRRSW